jgi:peptidoglycan/LPS O-acetylase OafA/YrhL
LYGKFGVRVFFILSGYLITHLLLRSKRKPGPFPCVISICGERTELFLPLMCS